MDAPSFIHHVKTIVCLSSLKQQESVSLSRVSIKRAKKQNRRKPYVLLKQSSITVTASPHDFLDIKYSQLTHLIDALVTIKNSAKGCMK